MADSSNTPFEVREAPASFGDRFSGVVLSAAVAVCAAVGFFYGPPAVSALTTFWSEYVVQAFTTIYVYGLSLCT